MKNTSYLLLVSFALTATSMTSRANEGGVLSIGGGSSHSAGITSLGTVYTAGNNSVGQLGDGTTTNSSSPVAVLGLTNCTKVAIGFWPHTLALKANGTVWAWGGNGSGQLGDGTLTTRSTPVQVTGLSGVVGIAAGNNSSYAYKSDGTVWAWGLNSSGQLGDGTTTSRSTPVQVSGLTGVIGIGAGVGFCLALRDDGTVRAWGSNAYGSLGDGTTINRSSPVTVTGVSNVTKIAAGFYHSLALKGDGTILTWGQNANGQLGIGVTGGTYLSAQTVSGISQVVSVAGGGSHSVAIKSNGAIWAWGSDGSGQLGDSATASSTNVPTYAAGFSSDAGFVAAGGSSTLALESNGYIWAWGGNANGMLGDGTTTTRFLPSFVGAR